MAGSAIDWVALREKLPAEKTPEQKEKRQALFRQFDPNGNGYLSLAECDKGCIDLGLKDILPKPVIMRAFQASKDVHQKHGKNQTQHGNDYVEANEFRLFLLYLCRYLELNEMFIAIDSGSDRRINFEEFQEAVPKLAAWGVEMEMDDPRREFDLIDKNGGGQILFDEFSSWGLTKSLDLEGDDD